MQEKSSRRFWVALVLAFFAIDITIAVIAISMAAGDPSFRTIPGFGQRSVDWEVRKKEEQRIADRGWTVDARASTANPRKLSISVLDKDRQPVPDLSLTVTLFHYTRVAEQQVVPMTWSGSAYEGDADLAKPGLWHLDIAGALPDGTQIWTQRTLELDPVR
ncbi:FixH [Pirellula sp. SH-Sr6A]|uniref:FixH family protein n=1 Tax=Pirellula sp. SH-Sr6A TaxID=1632865 RepID=UPI00078BA204|nr:FixH family protein [Pirellula sp. SH-Sr6A]AMV31814.1 FixH [Pirellula sp. SH-Sr6A]